MKRLIRWIINWLYAEEIAALVQEAVDDEFEATWLPGMRLYEFNYKTGECREIGTETTLEIDVTTGKPVTRRAVKVQYNPDCVYLQALNNRNAMRKLVKAGYIKMVKQDGKGPHVED